MTVTNHSILILNNLTTSFHYPSQTDVQIWNMVRDIKQFIKSQLIVTRADKGNITVAFDKNFYISTFTFH